MGKQAKHNKLENYPVYEKARVFKGKVEQSKVVGKGLPFDLKWSG